MSTNSIRFEFTNDAVKGLRDIIRRRLRSKAIQTNVDKAVQRIRSLNAHVTYLEGVLEHWEIPFDEEDPEAEEG